MKKIVVILFALLVSIQIVGAVGKVSFTVVGLQSGDKSFVSLGGDTYLATQTITADGDYSFADVPAGTHSIKIEVAGYNLPQAQMLMVKEDGSVLPSSPLQLVVTKMVDNPNEWRHSWSEDESTSGYVTTAHIATPPEIEFLGKKIVPADVASTGVLCNNYNIILSNEGEAWTQEYAYRLLETLKTIPYLVRDVRAKFTLTSNVLENDIVVTDMGAGKVVTLSKEAFYYANPFLVNLDGVRGRFFSKRLHHALVNYATEFGQDEEQINQILRERFGCTTDVPDYEFLTAGITNEDAACFQKFLPTELVSIINMFEEMPEGFHKIPHLNYLLRRQNGHRHPIYPEAAAVAWTVDNGYIEFMESCFGGNNMGFETLRLILHEKTHFLWAFSFSDEVKNDWIALGGWYEDPNAASGWSTTKDTEFVSAYAHAKNPDEDMAESVAHYIKNPELLQSRSFSKYEFIRDRIMHGTRYISKIPDPLTFEVLNLNPDYDYPGKIKRLDVKVEGVPEEDKTVTVEIELNHMEGFEDGASTAFVRITSPMFKGEKGEKLSQFRDLYLNPVDGNPYLLRGEVLISKYSKTGYWTAGDIVVSDLQGNQRFEGCNDCVWNMYVNNPLEDVEAPKYVSGSLAYKLTDVVVEGHQAQNLEVSFKVIDNIGLREVEPVMVRLSRGEMAYSFGDRYGSYDAETQMATINYTITEYFPTADYYVESISIYDRAQTCIDVPFSDSPQHEPIKKIHIITANSDTKAPELDLNRISVFAEPTNKEAPDGETLVTINYYARDDKSGLGGVRYNLRDPQGIVHGEYHYHRNSSTIYFDGDPTVWEKYTINCVLPKGSAPGIWGVADMELYDKALNGKTYNFVETLIFEPDDSNTDYVLFSELNEDNLLDIELSSETVSGYGFFYRIIHEDTGEEIIGEVDAKVGRTDYVQSVKVDVSSLADGELIVIIQVKDEMESTVAVRSCVVTKGVVTGIFEQLTETTGLAVYGGRGKILLNASSERKVAVYSIGGTLLKVVDIPVGITAIPMVSGFYIVDKQKCFVK